MAARAVVLDDKTKVVTWGSGGVIESGKTVRVVTWQLWDTVDSTDQAVSVEQELYVLTTLSNADMQAKLVGRARILRDKIAANRPSPVNVAL
jgi:hypothetical protein